MHIDGRGAKPPICKFHDFEISLEMRTRVFAAHGQSVCKIILPLILSEKPCENNLDFQSVGDLGNLRSGKTSYLLIRGFANDWCQVYHTKRVT